MEKALNYLNQQSKALASDPLYHWIGEDFPDKPNRKLDSIIPLIGFILSFPAYNLVYLKVAQDEESNYAAFFVETLNAHAKEDAKHANLFIQDLKEFNLAEGFGLDKLSDWLWVVWNSPLLKKARDIFYQRIHSLILTKKNLYLRYLQIEQIEIDGHFLFSAYKKAAKSIEKERGKSMLYFGAFHLDREEGHVAAPLPKNLKFNREEIKKVKRLIDEKINLSIKMNDFILKFSQESCEHPKAGWRIKEEKNSWLLKTKEAINLYQQGKIESLSWSLSPIDNKAHPKLASLWEQQHQHFLSHPLFKYISESDDIEKTLRLTLFYFANRSLALESFHKFDLASQDFLTKDLEFESAFKEIRGMFSTHFSLFYYDWNELDMDARLKPLTHYINLIFIDKKETEMFALHKLREEIIQMESQPKLKFFCYLSINAMASAFTKATQVAAGKYFKKHQKILPYMEGLLHLHYSEVNVDWNKKEWVKTLYKASISSVDLDKAAELFFKIGALGIQQWDNLASTLEKNEPLWDVLA